MNTLLRIEAVNLAFVIDDSEDLSTRRGGSTLLISAVDTVKRQFSDLIEPISTGASVGLFALKSNAGNAQQVLSEVRQFLQNKAEPYAHATFAVDLVQDNDFRIASEKAVCANRWRQMSELNFTTLWGDASQVCETDEIRPGTETIRLPDNKTALVSASVHARRRAGRELRQSLYSRILGENLPLQFTNETQSLSTFQVTDPDFQHIPANLNGKMAIFYADGNRFGHYQRKCRNAAELHDWDNNIKQKRQCLLRELLAWLEQSSWARTDADELRFETLLWGGDELLFLMPAWLGLEFSERFFALTADWTYGGDQLSHAAGLVFAKHSTPISQLQKLAKQLAEHGKTETRKGENTLSWVVLESFDHTGDSMENFWARNGIADQGWDKLLLTADRLVTLRATEALKDALPRSAMVRALRILATGCPSAERKLLQSTYRSTEQSLTKEQLDTLARLWALFGASWSNQLPEDASLSAWAAAEAVPWTALLELWDYLLPNAPVLKSMTIEQETVA